jgi:hypothetical protein
MFSNVYREATEGVVDSTGARLRAPLLLAVAMLCFSRRSLALEVGDPPPPVVDRCRKPLLGVCPVVVDSRANADAMLTLKYGLKRRV